MADKKRELRLQGKGNESTIVPFDDALRRLVNTPPMHRTKKEGGTVKRRLKSVTKLD